MKKIALFIGLLAGCFLAIPANAQNITFSEDTTVSLVVNGETVNFTVLSNGQADQIVVNEGSMVITLPTSETIVVRTTNRNKFNWTSSGATITQQCIDAYSQVTLVSDAAGGSVTITPEAGACDSASSGGGGGGGGGSAPAAPSAPSSPPSDPATPPADSAQPPSDGSADAPSSASGSGASSSAPQKGSESDSHTVPMKKPQPDPLPVLSDVMLIRYKKSPTVYLIEDGRKRPIVSERDFFRLGYAWKQVKVVPDTMVFPTGPELIFRPRKTADIRNGFLIRYTSSPRIYLVRQLKLYWIPSAEDFTALGYAWEDVVNVHPLLQLPFGGYLRASGITPL